MSHGITSEVPVVLVPMRRVYAAYLGLGLLMAPVPLLNVLQAEAAAVVALVAFFVSGFSALRAFDSARASVWHVLARQEAAVLIPLGVLTLAQLWAPNCTYLQGLLFYALFPGVTVVFAGALAFVIQGLDLSRRLSGLVLGGLGLLIGVGGPLYDLGLHPQFYTYNHVFGGVLGPIYDEQLAVRPGLFAFRGLTLLWATAAVLIGRRLRGRGPRWALPVCALAIGAVYAFSAPLGINTPTWYLQEQLGGHTRTPHFDLYYDPDQLDEPAVRALAETHEAQYDWVRRRLDLGAADERGRIQSYIYPNPDVKGRLTGARTTSVSPVWLPRPQVHLLRDRVSSSLGHELAHVASRPYGLPVLRASWAPGLIEGWAVALEPPAPTPSPDDLVLTAATADTTTGLRAETDAIASRLSPWGFWTGRGAVSYATMGSFVRYLLDQYGPEKLKRVYAWGNFEAVYGRPLRALATGWAAHLRQGAVVARGAHAVVTRQFTRPSLFETECPHYVPPPRRHLQAARRAGRRRDTTAMVTHLRRALAARPRYAAAHRALARIRLARGQAGAVRRQLDTLAAEVRTVGLRVALGDARALEGAATAARTLYAESLDDVPPYAPGTRARVMLRDAVATRPSVLRILVSGDSAAVQARRLAEQGTQDTAVRAWRAVRLMDAHLYASALAVWREGDAAIRPDRPRGWQRAWTLQRTAWGAEAALRAGSTAVARRWAGRAAQQARTLGDRDRAALFDWWAGLAETGRYEAGSAPFTGQDLLGGVRRSSPANHVPGLSVEASREIGRGLGPAASHGLFSRRTARVGSMRFVSGWLFGLCVWAAGLGLFVGCKGMQQTDENAAPSPSAQSTAGPELTSPAENVQTIQLYRGNDERSLPVAALKSGDPLTLEFDLMVRQGRPLSIYFHHTDRTWRRDLTDSQILESFQDDRLVDYRSSRGTDVPYVHYVYRFPNDDIRFRLSGNYLLRVTERGRRDSVLFEQPFFVTEETGTLRLEAESFLLPNQRGPTIRPRARYTPPPDIRGDPFGYSVCFVRDGRLPGARCEERPQLVSQPELEFQLERDRAFAPITARYGLDLSSLRATPQIARTDHTVSPIRVVLDADYARFAENTPGPDVNGQIVVRGALTNQVDPALSAEYVRTTFAFVPSNERPYGSELVVAGSFSGMDPDRGTTMRWVGTRNRYEGTVLLKQGQYQYFYATSDPALGKEVRRTRLKRASTYTAFVYYRDARRNTDRLLRVNGFRP